MSPVAQASLGFKRSCKGPFPSPPHDSCLHVSVSWRWRLQLTGSPGQFTDAQVGRQHLMWLYFSHAAALSVILAHVPCWWGFGWGQWSPTGFPPMSCSRILQSAAQSLPCRCLEQVLPWVLQCSGHINGQGTFASSVPFTAAPPLSLRWKLQAQGPGLSFPAHSARLLPLTAVVPRVLPLGVPGRRARGWKLSGPEETCSEERQR